MTSKPAPHHPQTSQPPALKQLAFAFPFLRKTQGDAGASTRFTDEHDIYRLLAANEASGAYLVSRKGMWHGGVHITEAGAGKALDLDAGLRCIADGVLIAYRANQNYPVSEVSVDGSSVPLQAPYSTGFALVRHEMEFPRGTKLTFYSLYMHLMSNADYDNFPKRQKPAYWSRQWQVTQFARDRPRPGRSGQVANPSQLGLHVCRTPSGAIVGILPQGASVSICKTETMHGATWGQLTDLNGAMLYAPEAGGYVAPSVGVGGWIYLGAQNGGPVAKESIPDSMFDRVIVTANQTCIEGDPHGTGGGFPVKAGVLIGHPGRYDSLNECSGGTRMAHIEVFCDGNIKHFINSGRDWVRTNCGWEDQWSELGLSPEPTILRVDRRTTLYHDHENGRRGKDSNQTDVIQVYPFATLPQDDGHMFKEQDPGNDGAKRRWWKVDSADALRNPVNGWVREQSFEGGRVTREFSQSWIDFEYHDEDHDPTHTIFASAGDYVDYAFSSDAPGAGFLGKLSPLMAAIYRVLYPTGDGQHAADELCSMGQSAPSLGFPWAAFRASRLIARHESEWANPAKWQALVSAIEERTGPKAEHEEEKRRIAKLVWWDEVAAGVPGFPGPDVYHINPIGLVGNFARAKSCNCITYDAIWVSEPAPAYRESQIANWSHYRLPIDTSSGRVAGNSRRGGDAPKDAQIKVIDFLVQKGRQYHLGREDIAMVLAMTRHESGFNPDAAAGTTSASGLGQFVDQTAAAYGINTNSQRFDAEQGADAMVRHYLENKRLATAGGATGRKIFVMTYAYHHDGPSLAYGGREISESKVMPVFDLVLNNICSNVAD
ncbi:glycoside hydrolase family 19 protein [Paraburkholderia sp. UYCP14C]|uniref:transglycosylase SLT domain-containing protein n=1 Tax=Paraburkholderia sp. UYCP14C TaxID=2511130 RepID=UPI0010212ADC|nr:transglycosylase SLT domain-containing protein [Paraburkholderia sp. UYCP14C]RZF27748.1 glycoside hydrolase family 19 protein [Paraburkholderia sp. UYCP14C]